MPSSTSRSTKKSSTTKTTPAKKTVVKAAAASKPATKSRTTTRKSTVTAAAATSPTFVLTHEVIAQRAHDLYVQSGFQGHRQVEFWLEAERQLREGFKA